MRSGDQERNDDIFKGLELDDLDLGEVNLDGLDFGDVNPDDFFQDIEPLSEEQLTWLNNFFDRGNKLKEILDCIRENNERKAVNILLANTNLIRYFTVNNELSVDITLNDVLKLLWVFLKKRMYKMIGNLFKLNPVLQDYFSGKPVNLEGVGAEPQALDLAQAKSQFAMALHYQSRLIYQILWNNYPALRVEILNSKNDELLLLKIEDALKWFKSILASNNQALIKYFIDSRPSLKDELLRLKIEDALIWFTSILASKNHVLIKHLWHKHPSLRQELLKLSIEDTLKWLKSILASKNQALIKFFCDDHPSLKVELLKLPIEDALKWLKSILASRNQALIKFFCDSHPSLRKELLKLSIEEAFSWLKSILVSYNELLAKDYWDNHVELQKYVIELTGKASIEAFKKFLSSRNQAIIEAVWAGNKNLPELIKALDLEQAKILLKKVLSSGEHSRSEFIKIYLNYICDLVLLKEVYKEVVKSDKNSDPKKFTLTTKNKLSVLSARINEIEREHAMTDGYILPTPEVVMPLQSDTPVEGVALPPISGVTENRGKKRKAKGQNDKDGSRPKRRKKSADNNAATPVIYEQLPTLVQLGNEERFYISASLFSQLKINKISCGVRFRKAPNKPHYIVTLEDKEAYQAYKVIDDCAVTIIDDQLPVADTTSLPQPATQQAQNVVEGAFATPMEIDGCEVPNEYDPSSIECPQRALESEQAEKILPLTNLNELLEDVVALQAPTVENSRENNRKRKRNSEDNHSDNMLIYEKMPTLEQLEGQKRFYVSQQVQKEFKQAKNRKFFSCLLIRKVTKQQYYVVTIQHEEDYRKYIAAQDVSIVVDGNSIHVLPPSVEMPAQVVVTTADRQSMEVDQASSTTLTTSKVAGNCEETNHRMHSGSEEKNDGICDDLELDGLDFGDVNPDDFFEDIEPLSEEQLTWFNNFCDRGNELKEILDCIREHNERKAVDILLANKNLSSYFTVNDELSVDITLNDVLKLLGVFSKKRMHKMIGVLFKFNPVLQDYFSGKPVNLERVGAEPQVLDLTQAKSQFAMALHSQYRLIAQILWDNYPALRVEILHSKEPEASKWMKSILASHNQALIKYFFDQHQSLKTELLKLRPNDALTLFKSILASNNQALIKYFFDNHKLLKTELLKLRPNDALTLFKSILASRNQALIKYFFDNHKLLKTELLKLLKDDALTLFKSILASRNQALIKYFFYNHPSLRNELLKLPIEEAFSWLKSILASDNELLAKDYWDNHVELHKYVIELTGEASIEAFKKFLSSRNHAIIESVWSGNKNLPELIKTLDLEQAKILLKKVLSTGINSSSKFIKIYLNYICDLVLLQEVYKEVVKSDKNDDPKKFTILTRQKLSVLSARINEIEREHAMTDGYILPAPEVAMPLQLEAPVEGSESPSTSSVGENRVRKRKAKGQNDKNRSEPKRRKKSADNNAATSVIYEQLPTLAQLGNEERFCISASLFSQLKINKISCGVRFRKAPNKPHYIATLEDKEAYQAYKVIDDRAVTIIDDQLPVADTTSLPQSATQQAPNVVEGTLAMQPMEVDQEVTIPTSTELGAEQQPECVKKTVFLCDELFGNNLGSAMQIDYPVVPIEQSQCESQLLKLAPTHSADARLLKDAQSFLFFQPAAAGLSSNQRDLASEYVPPVDQGKKND